MTYLSLLSTALQLILLHQVATQNIYSLNILHILDEKFMPTAWSTLPQLYFNRILLLRSHSAANRHDVSMVTHFTCAGTVHVLKFRSQYRLLSAVAVFLGLGYYFESGHDRFLEFTLHNHAQHTTD